MTTATLFDLISQGEGGTTKFVPCTDKLTADIYQTVCSFANSFGGHIFMGVNEDGEIIGISPSRVEEMQRAFAEMMSNPGKINPPLFLSAEEYEADGKTVLYVYVPKSSQVHTCDKTEYTHVGGADVNINGSDAENPNNSAEARAEKVSSPEYDKKRKSRILTKAAPDFDRMTSVAILFGLWFCGGIYGFLYETLFYFLNSGLSQVYWRGGGFGPWLQIYGFGSLLIYYLCYRFKKKPLVVILLSGLGCGVLELAAGYIFYGLCGIKRGWDYNYEILNFGNIGGYVCLRSVVVFALSGLILVYLIAPTLFKLAQKMNRTVFIVLCVTLGGLFLADFVYNDIVRAVAPSLVYAEPLYSSLGVPYLSF